MIEKIKDLIYRWFDHIIAYIILIGFIICAMGCLCIQLWDATAHPTIKATKITLENPLNSGFVKEYVGDIDIIEYSTDDNHIKFKQNEDIIEVTGWLVEVQYSFGN